ncbi:uncharacterized protein PHACADRAFT_174771 [Phanerochaete carnosa HHB-10118-sp]|uniref:Phosphatidylinositol 4-kinase n=1 Tax=Phanerochaete carnosa (strain HHB-10118-sp) TaxID=650164 RepID=K5WUX0_PHACS|nr:uncharacterized protein PHACADRAFT_174771 [Phanerochaete carnosa HHB-10118-sp]EKM54262.1 hypothetical protein PHACADRAFT_174771 [Phanerochaete carnosa HHB-10118-sp]
MPHRAEYQPLAQHIDDDDDEGDVSDVLPAPVTAPSRRGLRLSQRPGNIDLKKLDHAFKRWTESIAQKVKRKKKVEDKSRKEIWHSVFAPQIEPVPTDNDIPIKTLDHKPPMMHADFQKLVDAVKDAITDGIHPKMITKGSSGSYFARARSDGKVQTVAVFKPKDEEPYGDLNPKLTKWLHRQFRWIIPFGRACLIPNLSYISEAAASLLDERLEIHIVPRTELVPLSSPAFYYHWLDRNAAKKGKPLPEKIGSMQYFLHGYTDASEFLRKHPWPGRALTDTFDDDTHRRGKWSKKFWATMKIVCGKTGTEDEGWDEEEREEERMLFDATENVSAAEDFYWTPALQDNFCEELEKLVILDYLMLNTDRGADNYMIKFCCAPHGKSLVDVAPSRAGAREMTMMAELRQTSTPPMGTPQMTATASNSNARTPSMSYTGLQLPYTQKPHIHIAAIDNSLSFPHEHPKGWRSFTYGWLYLPVTIIGRPFSQKTRDHFLPLLTSKQWWSDTTFELRKLFAVDPGYHEKMFARQLAVIKGQAWNIVQSLKHAYTGPLELTRRQKVLVWDDEMELTEDNMPAILNGPGLSRLPPLSPRSPRSPHSPHPSISTLPERPRSRRSNSVTDFPPPMRRVSSEHSRPVSFSAKFSRVHPATTGVTVLEHMERLDQVEAGLKRLVLEEGDGEDEDEEEIDVGTMRPRQPKKKQHEAASGEAAAAQLVMSPSAQSERLPAVPEHEDGGATAVAADDANSITEEDLVAMSKSMSHIESTSPHARWMSAGPRERADLDWMDVDAANSPRRRVVIAERLETVDINPFFSCW